jgi:general secretion pathway protein A
MTAATDTLPESPFQSSDPRFDYWSAAHRLAFEQLEFILRSGLLFATFTGEVGTGKSTIIRQAVALEQVRHLIGVVQHGAMLNAAPARAVMASFGADPGPGDHDAQADVLERSLASARTRHGLATLIVEDAHLLKSETLGALVALAGPEREDGALFRLLLVGHPDLRSQLRSQTPGLVGPGVHLDPMSAEDTAGFVRHRLAAAGLRAIRFDAAALKTVHDLTGGVPLRINLLCMYCLDEAWDRDIEVIDEALVRDCNVEADSVLGGAGQGDTDQRAGLPA